MALQILGYIVDFYRHLVESQKGLKKLPPVFPIMIYNGERRWAAPLNLSALIEGQELLGKYALHFKYFPIIENAFSQEDLLRIGNIVSTLFLAEAHYDLDLLSRVLWSLFNKSRDKQAVSLLLNWVKQLAIHGRIDESDYKKLEHIYQSPKEVNMMINAIKREKKQLREEGIAIGMEKGKSMKGLEMAKSMLESGEPMEKIKRYTGLSVEVIKKLKKDLVERKN